MKLPTFLRLGLAAAAAVSVLPAGSAAASHTDGPAEYGVIERQCEAHNGYLFTNYYQGLRLICSGPNFNDGAKPAQMACERMDGIFSTKGGDEPSSWYCFFPGAS